MREEYGEDTKEWFLHVLKKADEDPSALSQAELMTLFYFMRHKDERKFSFVPAAHKAGGSGKAEKIHGPKRNGTKRKPKGAGKRTRPKGVRQPRGL